MTTNFSVEPAFVGDTYPAFAVHYRPAGIPRAHIIYLPPFAEEMNRCRAIVAEQARWFAQSGFSCATVDFYGTGESFGELRDATIPIWHHNISDLITSLTDQSDVPVYLWGCRLGALIAMDYLQSRTKTCQKLLLWQPVVSGKLFVTQMLRQRIAALMERGAPPETTTDIRTRLAGGETIEVAGYSLGGELISQLDQLDMAGMGDRVADAIIWLEHSMDGSGTPNPKTASTIALLEQAGTNVTYHSFTGPPIWQLHERDTCVSLLASTQAAGL